ncbi:NADP-dependent oxidoreductase [Lutibaculum baratangense]|uniref:Putative oxidoreductase YncB n=1 Tax=Lutibaculum baratangense AMV1 TaxID=631454 RepID=V4RNF4_9HYPH|nr:NADP-dependent oxidoreductase [Lutibaculum baratangense]ESR24740.1 putative oxidoreductase YncB [Lutibaculum baratangense AMV1]
MSATRSLRLASRPTGRVRPENFEIREEPLPEPGDGEFRVKLEYVSLDPAMRGWLSAARSYVPPVEIGEVMRAFSCGTVEASNNPDFPVGQAVAGRFGVRHHAISDGTGVLKVDTNLAPLPRWVGGLGMPGWTAYFGLLEVGRPKEGETVVVSAASGAVGSLVGQIAKLKGCRVVGIAGGPRKCAYVTDELGFDACVDYKTGSLADDLRTACPDGIDVYFENVGGEILDIVLDQMNDFGRIPFCGMISAMNATEPQPGPYNFRKILTSRLTVRGFIVFDFADRIPEALDALGRWHGEGRLKMREDIREGGLEAFADTLNELYSGGNNGKLVLAL